jgi:hypothetical protein
MMHKFKGWKTLTFNILMALVPILEMRELLPFIPQDYMALYALVVAMGNMYLRSITTTPMGKK